MTINSGIFNLDDLVRCYSLPSLASVDPGNKVMLKSGGPCMTVCEGHDDGTATCQWLDAGELVSHRFRLATLTCWGAQ